MFGDFTLFYDNSDGNIFSNSDYVDLCVCLFTLHNILRLAGIMTLMTRPSLSYASKDLSVLMLISVCARSIWYLPIRAAVDVFVLGDILVILMATVKVFTMANTGYDPASRGNYEKAPPYMEWKNLAILGFAICISNDAYWFDVCFSALALLPWLSTTPNTHMQNKSFCCMIFAASRCCTFIMNALLPFDLFALFWDVASITAIVHFQFFAKQAPMTGRDRRDEVRRRHVPIAEKREKTEQGTDEVAAREAVNTTLAAISRTCDVSAVIKKFGQLEEMKLKPDAASYHAVLAGCARSGATKLATEWFARMVAENVPCETTTFNHLITAFAKCGDFTNAEWWFHQIDVYSLSVSTYSFHGVMNAYAKVGNYQMTERWYDRMKERNFVTEVSTFNILILAATKAGLSERAEMWFDELETLGLKPDQFTLCTMMTACEKSRLHDRVEHYFDLLKKTSTPDLVAYHIMMSSRAKNGEPEDLARLCDELVCHGVEPTAETFGKVIGSFCYWGKTAEAVRWYDKLVSAGLKAGVITYNRLIECHARKGDVVNALHYFERLKSDGLVPTPITHGAVVKSFANSNRPQEAERFIQSVGGVLDPASACLIIAAYGRMGGPGRGAKKAEEAFVRMCSSGFVPTTHHYNALLTSFGESGTGALDKMVKIVDEMHAKGLEMDEATLHIALKAAKKSQRCDIADYFLNSTRGMEYKPRHFAVLAGMRGAHDSEYWTKWKAEMDRAGFQCRDHGPRGIKGQDFHCRNENLVTWDRKGSNMMRTQ